MPYASLAQERLFHAKLARGEISAKTVHEFDAASKGKRLPAHKHSALVKAAKKKKRR